jgi:alpha-methylacyl-CoA racemase
MTVGSGPLTGVRVLELAGIGPAPFAVMLLADLGAEVIRVDRVGDVPAIDQALGRAADATDAAGRRPDLIGRGRRSIAVDLKQPAGRDQVLALAARCDVLVEGFRPGVMERLGLGPDECLERNPRLVYGRMTGWGQDGPLAQRAGHDLTYLAITGALDGSRRAGQRPVPPMNLLGDLGGGSLYLALGLVSALFDVSRSGSGQVVDAAIVDGVASMGGFILGLRAAGLWSAPAGGNLLDTGAPFYDVYTCRDGREVAVGALEPQFYAELVRLTGMDHGPTSQQRRLDRADWPAARQAWAELFAGRSRDEWAALLADTDACVAPVLDWDEAAGHPQLAERGSYLTRDGVAQAAPAPRFSRTPGRLDRPAPWPGQHTDEVLAELGLDGQSIGRLRRSGAVG